MKVNMEMSTIAEICPSEEFYIEYIKILRLFYPILDYKLISMYLLNQGIYKKIRGIIICKMRVDN